jgi:hypothetical protein
VSAKFARRLEDARAAACPGTPPRGTCFYRRAVATEERRARPAPALPCPGLRLAGAGVEVLVASDLRGGAFTRDAVDDALAAARAAGAEWAAAWTDDAAEVAVLRDLRFQPLPHAEFTPGSGDRARA